jgi:hypothetical protein
MTRPFRPQFRLRSLFILTAIASEVALFIVAAQQPERLGAAIVGGLALVALWMCISGFMPAKTDNAPVQVAPPTE